ncbi:MAG: ACP S-malonyltransferase [Rhodobacteraceae bacterium]|nr:ACP S-malonyltransferase [Paracoccaceae bacterium]
MTKKTAIVFPGQGSQHPGMGRDLARGNAAARAVFEEVDDALGEALSSIIWDGPSETLTQTRNAQPAIMAMSIAVLRAMESAGLPLRTASFLAGHSLGEYTALCAAGALTLADTARLLRIRGDAMQAAVGGQDCAMAAILGLAYDDVAALVAEAARSGICGIANDNDPVQQVISGHTEAVEAGMALARDAGSKRAVRLNVSAPFHCALMEPAAGIVFDALQSVDTKRPSIPVLANVNATPYASVEAITINLRDQVTHTVRWRESQLWLAANGVKVMLEVGPGSVLTGLARRTIRSVPCQPVGTAEQIAAAMDALSRYD